MDNYATHKTEVGTWLGKHRRFHVQFTPTSGSWLNLVEGWFGLIDKQAIRRGVFTSVRDRNSKIRHSSPAGMTSDVPSFGARPPTKSSGRRTVNQLRKRDPSGPRETNACQVEAPRSHVPPCPRRRGDTLSQLSTGIARHKCVLENGINQRGLTLPHDGDPQKSHRRKARRKDLGRAPSSITKVSDWADSEAAITTLFVQAEAFALETADWYLADKRTKRRASRGLRGAVIVLGSAGGLAPLLSATGWLRLPPELGYVFLAVAAGCGAFDYFFGLSSAWARDIQAAQRVARLTASFQLDWARLCTTQASPAIEPRLDLIGTFTTDIEDILQSETASWATEFSASMEEIRKLPVRNVSSGESP